jgi:hypothetical protein
MAGTTWAALAANELVCHDEVVNAVATGQLSWSGGNPGIAGGYCYTRADYAAYISHSSSSLSGSGLATNELMSKSEMEAHRAMLVITYAEAVDATDLGDGTWHARPLFTVGGSVNSVEIYVREGAGSFNFHQTVNVSPGGAAYGDYYAVVNSFTTMTFRLTPFSGSNGGGTAGTSVDVVANRP